MTTTMIAGFVVTLASLSAAYALVNATYAAGWNDGFRAARNGKEA